MYTGASCSSVEVDGCMAKWAGPSHGNVLFRRPVVAGGAGPGRAQVHQGPAGHDAGGELGGAGGAGAAPVGDHRLAVRALSPVEPAVLGTVLDKDVHPQLLVLLPLLRAQLLYGIQLDEGFGTSTESPVSTRGESKETIDILLV